MTTNNSLEKKEIKNITETKEVPFWQPGLLMFSRMSGWIIGPVVLGIFLGKWLDRRYDTEPWLFLLTVGLAFIISMIGLVKDAFKEIEKLSKEDKDNKK
ncbi:MAG: AtpZ/AtpI family protein [Patescibacteria group bacterium]|jgi:F0F1-type ATP synthase assembly protein I